MPRLPQELVDTVIDLRYADSPHSMHTLSLVSRSWRSRSQANHFHSIKLDDAKLLHRLQRVFSEAPRLLYHPRHLSFVDHGDLVRNRLWLSQEHDVLGLMQSMPNIRALSFSGGGGLCLPVQGFIPLFSDASVFQLSTIKAYELHTFHAASCQAMLSLFKGRWLDRLVLDKPYHLRGDSVRHCQRVTDSLSRSSPADRLHVKYLSFHLTECILAYLLSPASLLDISLVSSLSVHCRCWSSSLRRSFSQLIGDETVALELNDTITDTSEVIALHLENTF